MIGYLQGEILEHSEGKMLIVVGDRKAFGSVGYSVSVPQSAAYGRHFAGEVIELFVHTHVREDILDLYGFSSKAEKALFLTLLSVNGIGPKGALGILSGVESNQLIEAIIHGDQAFLTRVPGIGKKTAERVVVELRDSMKKRVEAGLFTEVSQGHTAGGILLQGGALKSSGAAADANILRDAKDALVGLGYRDQDIQVLLNRILQSPDFCPQRAEDLVRTALRQLV